MVTTSADGPSTPLSIVRCGSCPTQSSPPALCRDFVVHPNTIAIATVCIHSPPGAPGMTDPDTYYEQFKKHGEIVFITICLRNGNLMKVSGAITESEVVWRGSQGLDTPPHRKQVASRLATANNTRYFSVGYIFAFADHSPKRDESRRAGAFICDASCHYLFLDTNIRRAQNGTFGIYH